MVAASAAGAGSACPTSSTAGSMLGSTTGVAAWAGASGATSAGLSAIRSADGQANGSVGADTSAGGWIISGSTAALPLLPLPLVAWAGAVGSPRILASGSLDRNGASRMSVPRCGAQLRQRLSTSFQQFAQVYWRQDMQNWNV